MARSRSTTRCPWRCHCAIDMDLETHKKGVEKCFTVVFLRSHEKKKNGMVDCAILHRPASTGADKNRPGAGTGGSRCPQRPCRRPLGRPAVSEHRPRARLGLPPPAE